jgi:hypothetical protein
MQKIAYEKHPMPEGREEKLRAAGYKILDIRFAPEGYEAVLQESEKRPYVRKADKE